MYMYILEYCNGLRDMLMLYIELCMRKVCER